MPWRQCERCGDIYRPSWAPQRYCGRTCARLAQHDSMTITRAIVLTDFGQIEIAPGGKYSDDELRRMKANWIKVLATERYEPALMSALTEIVRNRGQKTAPM